MSLNTTSGVAVLTPEQVEAFVIQPLIRQSVAMQVSTVIQTSSHETRFPIVQTYPTTA